MIIIDTAFIDTILISVTEKGTKLCSFSVPKSLIRPFRETLRFFGFKGGWIFLDKALAQELFIVFSDLFLEYLKKNKKRTWIDREAGSFVSCIYFIVGQKYFNNYVDQISKILNINIRELLRHVARESKNTIIAKIGETFYEYEPDQTPIEEKIDFRDNIQISRILSIANYSHVKKTTIFYRCSLDEIYQRIEGDLDD